LIAIPRKEIFMETAEGAAKRQPIYDREDQFQQIVSGLMAGEELYVVYDAKGAGTGFMALTDKRVIIQDKSYVGKKIAMLSVPYSKVATVGVLSDKSFMGNFFSTSEILVTTTSGTHHEVMLRGNDKAKYAHDLILHYITKS
jgi:hypothetical protein